MEKNVSRRGFVTGAAALGITGACTPVALATKAHAATDGEAHVGTGTGPGHGGDLVLEVVVDGDAIEDIVVKRCHETENLGAETVERLVSTVLASQNTNVDTISGATMSCAAFRLALEAALEDAGCDPEQWEGAEPVSAAFEADVPSEADVVVVGSGGAGMCAAITAAKAGKSVVVLEKLGTLGGSTNLSGFGYAAPGSWPQVQKGIEDTPALMAQDMLDGGDNLGDPELVDVICENALDGVEWLTYEAAVAWYPICAQDGGHSLARSILPIGYGGEVMGKLVARARELGVTIVANCKVDDLVVENGAVRGVKATGVLDGSAYEIAANAVVLATGGFGSNLEMRSQFDPALDASYGCTDCIGATGDGIGLAQAAGAAVTGMEYIQTHPTGDVQTGEMLDVGGIRTEGIAVMVNKGGDRFVEELERRDVVSKATVAQTGGWGYFVYSLADGAPLGYGDDTDEVVSMKARGVFAVGTLEEACGQFGIDAAETRKTIDTWNEDCAAGADSQFNYRADMFPIGDGPYCVFPVCPTVHYTMGGVAIDRNAHVLDEAGEPIEGLYAAGEVTGGIMGSNRLGTTSVTDIVCFGRIAGKNAAGE